MEQQTLIFMGPQGCGKGTQIKLLSAYLAGQDARAIVQFEMGNSLRALAQTSGFAGHRTHDILAGGNLIPYAISSGMFVHHLMEHLATNEEHLFIDGFPRTATQVPALDSALREFYCRPNPTVVVINITDDEAVKRLLARGRSDDTEAAIRTRLEWSRKETMPNLAWFKNNPAYRVVEVDGMGTIEETQAKVRAALGFN